MDGSVESLEKLRRWRPATSDAAVDSSSTSDASNQDGVVDSSDVSSKADALALGYGSGCVELDFDAYKRLRRSQCSVHVGDLHLQLNLNRKGGTEGNSDSNNEGDSRRRSALQDDDDAEATAAAAVEDINSEIADVGSTPLVTVLMPCFNGAAFVGRAVRSVLDQAQVIHKLNYTTCSPTSEVSSLLVTSLSSFIELNSREVTVVTAVYYGV